MTKNECEEIWEVIFARHRALVKMGVADHDRLEEDYIHEIVCNCITIVMKQYDYDINRTEVFGGIRPITLCSDWKFRLLNFEKKVSPHSSKAEHTPDKGEVSVQF